MPNSIVANNSNLSKLNVSGQERFAAVLDIVKSQRDEQVLENPVTEDEPTPWFLRGGDYSGDNFAPLLKGSGE